MTRWLISLAVLFCCAALAPAEPIRWTYTPSLAGDQGSAFVADGQGGRIDPSEPDGIRHYQGYTELTTAADLGPQAGSKQLVVGTVGRGGFYWLADPAPRPTLNDFFRATLTLRDDLSGLTGTVSVTGTAHSNDSWLGLPADLDLPDADQLWAFPGQDLVLGDNRYTVKFGERKTNVRYNGGLGWDWDSLEVVAEVQVAPTSQTPEPATLALAGVGLLGLLGLRRKK